MCGDVKLIHFALLRFFLNRPQQLQRGRVDRTNTSRSSQWGIGC